MACRGKFRATGSAGVPPAEPRASAALGFGRLGCSPTFRIPAFAGMTGKKAGNDVGRAGITSDKAGNHVGRAGITGRKRMRNYRAPPFPTPKPFAPFAPLRLCVNFPRARTRPPPSPPETPSSPRPLGCLSPLPLCDRRAAWGMGGTGRCLASPTLRGLSRLLGSS